MSHLQNHVAKWRLPGDVLERLARFASVAQFSDSHQLFGVEFGAHERLGRNFAAGMSGGIAYILDEAGNFASDRCNKAMVALEKLEDPVEIEELRELIQRHVEFTGSEHGQAVLADFHSLLPKFVKVIPHDYKRVLEAIAQAKADGLDGDEAINAAFEANSRDLSRVGGN